jgi:hypothetical protein
MMEKYYYCRDKQHRPIITVCLLSFEDGFMARGVSICSPKDQPEKEVGRCIAHNRALRSLLHRRGHGNLINRPEAISTCIAASCNFAAMKQEIHPTLTAFERKIIGDVNVKGKTKKGD